MNPGWYILLYHDVSWEMNAYLSGIGGSCPPDVFREHVSALAGIGDLASPDKAFRAWVAGEIKRPTFSFWFDDGLVGVRKYAAPVLARHGLGGGISVCSRFAARDELFWRFKASFLRACDGLRYLRPRLTKFGYRMGDSVKGFLLDRFALALIEELDAAYRACTTAEERADAFRLFDNREGLLELKRQGWTIANHTAAHYPVSEPTAIDLFAEQFAECERYLGEALDTASDFWVTPFDREFKRAGNLLATFKACRAKQHLVLVGNEVNHPTTIDHTVIHRIFMPIRPARQAIKFLKRLPYAATAGYADTATS